METGDLSQWSAFTGNGDAELATDASYTGNYSLALSLKNSSAGDGIRARVDKNVPGYSGAKNLPDDAYYSAWFFIPTHVSLSGDDSWNIYQWKQTRPDGNGYRRNYLEAIRLVDLGDRYGFNMKSRTDTSGNWANSNRRMLAENTKVTVKAGQWFHLESRRVYDQGFNGRITTWVNGQMIWDVTGIKTEYDWDFPNWRRQWTVNNYNIGDHSPNTHTLYIDDARVALNRQGP